jgi:hypothetical protein
MQEKKFETIIFKNVIEKEDNGILTYISFLLFAIIFIGAIFESQWLLQSFEYFPELSFLKLLICFSSLITVLLVSKEIRNFFIYQKLDFDESGTLKIDLKTIIFNDEVINWSEAKRIEFKTDDYYGKRIFRRCGDTRPRLSLGINNSVLLTTENNKIYAFNFQLASKDEYTFFKEFLWDLVKTSTFSLDNIKTIINPKNYKENQEVKKYAKS